MRAVVIRQILKYFQLQRSDLNVRIKCGNEHKY
jgi:hypothetical protein